MAGDWIKIEVTMPDKPEVAMIAESLKIDHDSVVGKLLRFWIWADLQSVDGDALGVTLSFLDRLTNCPGFSDALVSVGWLISRNGRLSVPNFDRHNGQTAKSRALTKDRMKRSRYGTSVTKSSPEKRREEKRRIQEPTHTHGATVLVKLKPPWDSPECGCVFDRWFGYLATKGKPPFDREQTMVALSQLFACQEDFAAAVNLAIANSWVTVNPSMVTRDRPTQQDEDRHAEAMAEFMEDDQ